MSFDELKLSEADIEIIDGDRGVNYPKQNEFYDIGYCLFLNAKNVTKDGFDFNEKSFISREKDNLLRKGKLVRNDIVLTTRGTVGNVAFYNNRVPFNNIRINSGMVILRAKQSEYLPEFVYWMFRSNYIQDQINALKTGSAQPQLPITIMRTIKVLKPKLCEQKAIAATLSALDDMIELNNQINKTLEEMAQTIFKSWFVDFEPFKDGEFEESELGLIPKGWRVVELNDISKDIICGKTPSTKDNDNYGNKMPFITIPDMHGNVFITKTERCLSQKGINIQKNKTLPKFSVCVSCIATPGLVAITSEESQTNQQINSVICKDNISCFYVYLFLNTIKDTIITLGSGGSTTLNLNKRQFSKIKIIKCDDRTMRVFHNLVKPLFFNILDNQIENQNLSEIRDTLLPKLMTGEIRVPVEEVV